MEKEKPFAYTVHHDDGRHSEMIGVFKSLADIVRCDWPHVTLNFVEIRAYYSGNRYEVLPKENYSRQDFATRDDARAFIDERNAEIKEAGSDERAITVMRTAGAFRCSASDQLEEQIAQYIASSPRVWLPSENIVEL